MADQPWFKVWAKESIGSSDLNSLTDHEERVWWRLLCVASTQDDRWHICIPVPALARMCASTPPKMAAALKTFQRQGMTTEADGMVVITNWEKYQETPDAARKRRQRERDKERDMSRDMSRTSHAKSHENVTGEEEEEEEEDLTPTLRSGVSGAQKRQPRARKPKPEFKPLTDEQRERIVAENPDLPQVRELIAEALAHESAAKWTDMNLHVRRWIRNERDHIASRRGNGHPVQRNDQSRNGNPGRDPDLARILERARREDAELERAAQ